MKKTVFEGIINGVKFDKVEDYNNEMMRLLKEGAQIKASSETKTVEENEFEKLPELFVGGDTGSNKEYYIDALVKGDQDDNSRYENEVKKLSNILARIDPTGKYDIEELERLRDTTELDSNTCCLQLKGILKDIENTKSEIQELNAKLEDFNKELEYNKNQDRIITLYNSFFKQAIEELQKNENKSNMSGVENKVEECCGTSCKCNKQQKVRDILDEDMDEYMSGYLDELLNMLTNKKP